MATGTQTDLLNRIRLLEKSTGTGGGDTGTGTPTDLGAFLLGGQSGGQIAAGGIANTENLTLLPSSDPMATGYVALYGGLSENLRTEQTGITTVSHGVGSELDGAAQLFIHSQYAQTRDQTSNVVGTPLFIQHDVDFLYANATSSLPGVFGPWTGISYSGTHTWSADPAAAFGLTLASYADFLINKNDAGNNRKMTPAWSNFSARQYIADGATLTFQQPDAAEGPVAYFDSTTYYTKNGGTLDASTHNVITGSFISDVFIGGNSHFTGRRAFWVKDINEYPFFADLPHSVLGGDVFNAVVDTNVGLYVEPLAVGTTNRGIVVNNPIVGYDGLNATYTATPFGGSGAIPFGAFISIADTFTLDYTTPVAPSMGPMLQFAATVNLKQSAFTTSLFSFVQNQGTFKNDASVAANLGYVFGLYHNPTQEADSQNISSAGDITVKSLPTFTTTGTTPVLGVTEAVALESNCTVSGHASVFSRVGVHVKNATITGSGSVASQIGIAIEALTGASSNIGISNLSSTQLGTAQQLKIDASGILTLNDGTAAHGLARIYSGTVFTAGYSAFELYGDSTDSVAMLASYVLSGQPHIAFGPGGSTTADVQLTRTATTTLQIAGNAAGTILDVIDGTAADGMVQSFVGTTAGLQLAHVACFAASGDANPTVRIQSFNSNGSINFGPGGSTATDANISRSAAAALATNSAFKSTAATGGVGYGTGAGGTATQLTSKTTAFPTISKVCGTLTWNNAALAADTTATTASSTNTAIAATDVVVFTHISGGTLGAYNMTATPGSGTWTLTLHNLTPGSLSEAPVFAFAIIKAVTS